MQTNQTSANNQATFPVRIGVDEFATETQKCDGWTYFCLPEAGVSSFTEESKAIIASSKLSIFHGKEFKIGHRVEYLEFLKLIRRYIGKSFQMRAMNVLLNRNFKTELQQFGNRILSKSLENAGVCPTTTLPILSHYIAPLFTLARLAEGLGPNVVMHVEIDDCNQFKDLNQQVHEVAGVPITADLLLKAAYNGYAKSQFPKAPQLPDDGIKIMRDSKSFLIQAADVLGNFSMAHTFVELGMRSSKSKSAKAALIQEVFGDMIESFDMSHNVSLEGNDLVLTNGAGAINFQIGWIMSKKPTLNTNNGIHK